MLEYYIPPVAVCLENDSAMSPLGESVNNDRECGQAVVAVTVHAMHKKGTPKKIMFHGSIYSLLSTSQ